MSVFQRDPFGDLVTEFSRVSDEVNRLFGARAVPVAGPAVNLWSDDQAVYAEADLPGFDPAKIDVSVTDGNQLTIQGERAEAEIPGAVWVRQERPSGRFSRTIALPFLIAVDRVTAKYEHGILKLTLPKSEAAKPRKITVSS